MRGPLTLQHASVGLALAALASYAAATLLVAGPDGVLQQRFGGPASRVLEPYGQQDWRLFAPDPVSADLRVQASARCADGRVTPRYDLTAAHRRAGRHRFLFPGREYRTLSNPVLTVMSDDPFGHLAQPAGPADDGPVLDGYSPAQVERYRRAERLLAVVASRDLAVLCPAGVVAVRLRFVVLPLTVTGARAPADRRPTWRSFESGWVVPR